MNINRSLTIKRYGVIVVGIEIVRRRPSPYRNGTDNWFKLIVPQRMPAEGAMPKNIGHYWFKPSKSLGDRHT